MSLIHKRYLPTAIGLCGNAALPSWLTDCVTRVSIQRTKTRQNRETKSSGKADGRSPAVHPEVGLVGSAGLVRVYRASQELARSAGFIPQGRRPRRLALGNRNALSPTNLPAD